MAQVAQPADITAVSNLLKKVYTSDEVKSQLQEDTMLYRLIVDSGRGKFDVVGDKAVGFVKTARNVGTSARSLNGGTLGAAGHQGTAKWELDYAANYVQIKLLGTTIAKMRTQRQAAVRAVDFEVTGALTDLKKEIQRQLYGDGTGAIANTNAVTSATIPLATSGTNATVAKQSNDAIIKGWLQVGAYVDVGTAAAPTTVVGDAKIVSLTNSDTAPAVQIDSSVTTTTAHSISKAGNRAAGVSYEMFGLRNVIGTGSFANLTDNNWVSNRVDASGGTGTATTLSRSQMQAAFRLARQYGGNPNYILTSLEHQEDYYNLLQSQVRFAGDSNLASGKVEGPTFNGITVLADPDAPRGYMWFINTRELFLVSAGDIAWQNTNTGGDVLAWSQGEDAFVARAALYANLGTTHRRGHSWIDTLAVN